MACYHVYADQLTCLNHGYALWEPDPGLRPPVRIGDVGYCRFGGFFRIFNVHLSADDPLQASELPEYFSPLPYNPNHVYSRTLDPGGRYSRSVRARGAEAGLSTGLVPLSGGISFECFREQGAVLAISEDATRQDAHLLVNYETYMLENCSRWLALVEMQGLGLRMEDIVLVTGCDLTSAWAVAAFTDSGVDASVQLHVGATPAGAVDIGTNVSWRNERNVERHWGPRRRMTSGFGADPFQQVATPSSEQNQCIFIRGYRVKFRSRFLPKKLVAAAEPVDYDMDDDEDHGPISTVGSYGNDGMLEVESIADDSHTPLSVAVLDYILEHSEAHVAIIHDQDLSPIFERSSSRSRLELQNELQRLMVNEKLFNLNQSGHQSVLALVGSISAPAPPRRSLPNTVDNWPAFSTPLDLSLTSIPEVLPYPAHSKSQGVVTPSVSRDLDIPALRKKAREQARRIRELQTWAQNVAVDSSSSNNNPPPDSDPCLCVPLIQTQNEPPALPSESSTSVTWPIKKAGGSTSEEEDSDSDSSCWDSVQHDRVTAQTSDIGSVSGIYSRAFSSTPILENEALTTTFGSSTHGDAASASEYSGSCWQCKRRNIACENRGKHTACTFCRNRKIACSVTDPNGHPEGSETMGNAKVLEEMLFGPFRRDASGASAPVGSPDSGGKPKAIIRRPCNRCKSLKVRCEYEQGEQSCKRCLRGDHECVVPERKARRPEQREVLLRETLTQDARIERSLEEIRSLKSAERASQAAGGQVGG
ncbi:uncharacterized protein STEHIDRAFT_172904 [Stereum hirsutum FP-91666 SS1]|uniref:Zn(2)-C6 fungal-type domain-containing protein n=1 Tax=Stereum hirsutum (strain FP-91666) TaxID=721885 RepID=R7RWZ3_STEHR|nr:uncharacterized protein STEHIDRAFT_172904 [Stereum hirsutum FP-91666 SS1]EIM79906.1 hypothetical protein STEHIDRAFT_172904 [Stereum hirsutum FP-91666 SS1]